MSNDATDNTVRAEFEAWKAGWKLQYTGDKPMRDETFFAGWQAARADTARQVAEAVAAEREACAALCMHRQGRPEMDAYTSGLNDGAASCEDAIRARSSPTPPTA